VLLAAPGCDLLALLTHKQARQTSDTNLQVAPFPPSRPNAVGKATEAAAAIEAARPPPPLDQRFVVAFIGLKGSGKTATIHKLLGSGEVDPFDGATQKLCAIDGAVHGIQFRFIDSPGLEVGQDSVLANRSKLIGVPSLH
jgi:hypothetical protein